MVPATAAGSSGNIVGMMQDNYGPVREAMTAGTPLDLICSTCPWNRPCVDRPSMTEAEVRQHTEDMSAAAVQSGRTGRDLFMAELVATAIYSGRDQMATVCPVFAARMQTDEGRQISDAIRTHMRGTVAG